MTRFRELAILFLMVCTARALPRQSPPDISGVWRLNPKVSQASGRPHGEMQVRIEQGGSGITITIRGDEETIEKLSIGSDDNHNQIRGAPMSSAVKWEGSTLVVDSVATFDADKLRMNGRWTLSPDGQTLTFKEHRQFKAEPAGDETMVFEKQNDATWAPSFVPPTAELKYKNIQVMKGMPASLW